MHTAPISTTQPQPLFMATHISVHYDEGHTVLSDINLSMDVGEHVGLIGYSGAGKSTLARALSTLLCAKYGHRLFSPRQGTCTVTGSVNLNIPTDTGTSAARTPAATHDAARTPAAAHDAARTPAAPHRRIRAHRPAHATHPTPFGMLFQDPRHSLNPALTIGQTLLELTRALGMSRTDGKAYIMRTLAQCNITADDRPFHRYPHQYSGGMCQRVAIAQLLISRPALIIADEPTSALDRAQERATIMLIRRLLKTSALIFISHRLTLIHTLCRRVITLADNAIVDDFPINHHDRPARHPISRALYTAERRLNTQPPARATPSPARATPPPTPTMPPIIAVADAHFAYPQNILSPLPRLHAPIFHDIALTIPPATTTGIVGASGIGKSTFLRILALLLPIPSGTITIDGIDTRTLTPRQLRNRRTAIQFIFQEPALALSRRHTTAEIIMEPLRIARRADPSAVARLMSEVGLARALRARYPTELSGGERQRLLIARALALSPRLLLADEPFSALDTVSQERLLTLFRQLHTERGIAICVASHRTELIDALCARRYRIEGRTLILEQ